MRKITSLRLPMAYLLCAVFLAGIGAAHAKEVKMPITTSSEKAREYFIQGRDLLEKLRTTESREFFEKAVAEDSSFALAYLELAYTQPNSRIFLELFDKALALADQASKAERLIIMAVQAGRNADPMLQRKYFKKLVDLYPNDERTHMKLAGNYFMLQDYAATIEHCNASIKINPGYNPPYNLLGYSHRNLGNYKEAEEAFKKYIELIPNDPNSYDSYAELLMEMGKFTESIKYYRKALEIEPHFDPSHIGIATNLNFMGQHEKAREQLQKLYDTALDVRQKREAVYAMAVSHADEGRLDLTLEDLQKLYALAEKSDDVSAMAHDLGVMGYVLLQIGKYDEASARFEKAVQLVEASDLSDEMKENTRRGSLYRVARVAVKKGDFATARAKAEEYRKQAEARNHPSMIRHSYELSGIIALAEKDYEQALADLQYSDQQNPQNLYRMALAFQGKGDNEKAREMCEEAMNANTLNNMSYAFIRNKTKQLLAGL